MPPQAHTGKKGIKSYRKKAAPKVSKNVKRYVSNAIKSFDKQTLERKFHVRNDNSISVFNGASGGQLFQLTGTSQGDTDQHRDGDRIRLQQLRMNYTMERNSTSVAQSSSIRMIIFQYFDDDTTSPTLGTVMQNSVQAMISTLNHDNLKQKKFKVLRELVVTMDDSDPTYTGSIVFPFRARNVQYNAGGVTGTGNVWLLVVGSDATTQEPFFSHYTKVTFTDA